jgi:methionyl-tRNA formyltransferase
MSRLKGLGVDIIICAAYPFKVPPWQNYVKYGINIHPSPLPEGRGVWPLPWLILKQFKSSAVSIHELAPSWDAGDIVSQRKFELSDRETLESLSAKSQMAARDLIQSTMADLESFWEAKRPQSGGGSYWTWPSRVDRTIDFSMDVETIDRIVRAFSKFEPFMYLDGVRYFVRKVDVWKAEHGLPPGTIALKMSREIVYAVVDGFLCLSNYEKAEEHES